MAASKIAGEQQSIDTKIPLRQFDATLQQTHGFADLDAVLRILSPILLPMFRHPQAS